MIPEPPTCGALKETDFSESARYRDSLLIPARRAAVGDYVSCPPLAPRVWLERVCP